MFKIECVIIMCVYYVYLCLFKLSHDFSSVTCIDISPIVNDVTFHRFRVQTLYEMPKAINKWYKYTHGVL